MVIPVYLWLKDEGGAEIKGSVDILGREGSIQINGLNHGVMQPTDKHNGKATSLRVHFPFSFDKEVDASSPYIYKAVTTGQKLKSAEVKYYRINDAGLEEEYFSTLMEGVKIVSVCPMMMDIKDPNYEKHNHMELVELLYEKSPGVM